MISDFDVDGLCTHHIGDSRPYGAHWRQNFPVKINHQSQLFLK